MAPPEHLILEWRHESQADRSLLEEDERYELSLEVGLAPEAGLQSEFHLIMRSLGTREEETIVKLWGVTRSEPKKIGGGQLTKMKKATWRMELTQAN